ncbi:alanine racemase [Marinisporobacter balticus]|uniref:Alanine racemase n=1 Tax=Marinisporobacter balticus TaxID=2018667 RepID=A0A4R2KQF1_9FIRM|nr:alanine racemase [Marinisporobacter balticus]TCO73156.1 alanine racemase [Marinisporobacter balticus]
MLSLKETRPVWAEINLDYLAHNIKEIRKIVRKESLVTAVIKADGYGHGAVEIAEILLGNGANRLAVATLSEALELRSVYREVPILILGYTPEYNAEEIIKNKITQTIYSLEQAQKFSEMAQALNQDVTFHIKIDTGMRRIGFQPNEETVKIIKEIYNLSNVKLEGIFTHFAVADEIDKTFTGKQYEKFISVVHMLEEERISIPIKHVSNSAATMDLQEMNLDMVRVGIILYGLYPSDEVKKNTIDLKPVLSLKVKISHVKTLPEGIGISYGLKYTTNKPSKIATIPIGYADGYTRMLSGKAEALVGEEKVAIVGRICMDQCMIDVTNIEDVNVGDEVILIGSDGKNTITVDDVAKKLDTINYEIVCMLGKRIPRVYIQNNKVIKINDNIMKSVNFNRGV